MEIAEQIDFGRRMLYGDHMRILLNSDHISRGEITTLLKEKGIFLDASEKMQTVPLLSSVILTPSEFEKLITRSHTRESTEKHSFIDLTLTKQSEGWQKEILTNIETIVGGLELSSGHYFVDRPVATRLDDGSVRVSYTVAKEDFSQDWIAQRLPYSGWLLFTEDHGKMQLKMHASYTCKETNRVNNVIATASTRHLKEKSIVVDTAPKLVKFDDFTNEERIRFFLKLTGASDRSFEFDELVDVDIVRDEAAGKLPSDPAISWMEGKVKRLHVSGEKLHNLDLVTRKEFHKYCFLVRMSAIFNFKYGSNTGKCTVAFWFTGKSATDSDFSDTEFTLSIEKLGRVKKEAERDIRSKVLCSLWKLRDEALNSIKAEQSAAAKTVAPEERRS